MKRPLTNDDEKCGLACIRPTSLQRFADIRLFVALMCVVIGIQGTYLGYAVGILTTVEKRFEISSSEAGLLLAMYDIGHTCTVLLVGYCLADRHKPRWTAYGCILSAVAMFGWSLPNFIFGTSTLPGAHQNYVDDLKCDFRRDQDDASNATLSDCSKAAHTGAYAILCISQLLAGISAAPFNTISYIYIDDNVSNRQSPFFLGILTSMYAFGPALGFGLSSLCTRLHADLKKPEGLDNTSPSWIGAWWLGFIICGVVYILVALPLLCFPYRLPDKRKLMEAMELRMINGSTEPQLNEETQSLRHVSCFKHLKDTTKELPFAVWQLLHNPVFTSMAVAWIFGSYLVGGYGTFLPQYIETQYLQSTSMSSIYAGLISIGSVALSTAAGGYLLSKFDIKPQRATLYLMITWAIIVITYLCGMATGCKESSLLSTKSSDGKYNYTTACSAACKCNYNLDFDPVYSGNTTYFSPCHAGCRSFLSYNNTWTECACTLDDSPSVYTGFYSTCNMLPIYLTIMFIGFFIGNMFFMVTMMVVLRCVQYEERSLALSFASCLTNIFGFIPSPIIFGAIIDSACNIWHSQCPNERGSCIQYNNNDFRHKYHLANAGFQLIAIVALVVTYLFIRRFKFPEDEEQAEEPNIEEHHEEVSND